MRILASGGIRTTNLLLGLKAGLDSRRTHAVAVTRLYPDIVGLVGLQVARLIRRSVLHLHVTPIRRHVIPAPIDTEVVDSTLRIPVNFGSITADILDLQALGLARRTAPATVTTTVVAHVTEINELATVRSNPAWPTVVTAIILVIIGD